jgi:hypothetical protein
MNFQEANWQAEQKVKIEAQASPAGRDVIRYGDPAGLVM